MSSGEAENAVESPKPAAPSAFSLDTILSDKSETLEHPDFKDKVNDTYAKEYPEDEENLRLARHVEVAKRLFAEEPADVQTRIRDEARAVHDGKVAEAQSWKDCSATETDDKEVIKGCVLLQKRSIFSFAKGKH